jgi:hypothetical protein
VVGSGTGAATRTRVLLCQQLSLNCVNSQRSARSCSHITGFGCHAQHFDALALAKTIIRSSAQVSLGSSFCGVKRYYEDVGRLLRGPDGVLGRDKGQPSVGVVFTQ